MPVVIAGAGNFGREVNGWATKSNFPMDGFLDDTKPGGRPIKSYVPRPDEFVIVAISDPVARQEVVKTLRARGAAFRGMELHLGSTGVTVGNGSILCPYSLASCNAKIGEFVIVNVMTSIGHDVVIADYCTISSQTDICGHVRLGKGVFVGSGARIMPRVKVGDGAKIGAGALVVNDVPAGATVYCQPGRIL